MKARKRGPLPFSSRKGPHCHAAIPLPLPHCHLFMCSRRMVGRNNVFHGGSSYVAVASPVLQPNQTKQKPERRRKIKMCRGRWQERRQVVQVCKCAGTGVYKLRVVVWVCVMLWYAYMVRKGVCVCIYIYGICIYMYVQVGMVYRKGRVLVGMAIQGTCCCCFTRILLTHTWPQVQKEW